MAEPPHVWAAPGDDSDDPPPAPAAQKPTELGRDVPAPPPPAPGQPNWGTPPGPGQQQSWGAPPSQPSQPNQWGAQPTPPTQWGGGPPGQPTQWGGQPQWGGPPPAGNWTSRGPGIVPLRPLAIGEIYDGAIRATRSNPRTMVGFSAIVIALLTLLATAPQAYALTSILNNPLTNGPEASESPELSEVAGLLGPFGITLLVSVLQFVLTTTIVSGLLIVAVDAAVRGQFMTPDQLWTRCRPRLLAVLGLAITLVVALPLVLLIAMLPGLIVVFVPSGEIAGVVLLVIGALAGAAGYVGLYLGLWAVAAPALLLENLGVFAALRRSYRLVRGSFWRVFGIGLLTAVIASIIEQIFSLPFAVIGGVISGFEGSDTFSSVLIQLLFTNIGTVLAGAALYPFTAGVAALLYLDLRMRREGLDVDLMRS